MTSKATVTPIRAPDLPTALARLDALVDELLEVGWDATRFDLPPTHLHALCELLDAAAAFERRVEEAA